jgi:hypothetical protein
MQSSNHTQNYRKHLYYLTHTKYNCASAHYIFKWDTSVTTHKRGKVVFTQRQPLPRSNANSSVNIYNNPIRSHDRPVCILTVLQALRLRSCDAIFDTNYNFSPFSKMFRSFLVPNCLLYNGAFTWVTTLSTHLHLVPRLGMSGATTLPTRLNREHRDVIFYHCSMSG